MGNNRNKNEKKRVRERERERPPSTNVPSFSTSDISIVINPQIIVGPSTIIQLERAEDKG